MNKILERKNAVWNIVGASANAFNSLFFVIIATRINGAEEAGIFSFGFATACILYFLGSYIVRAYHVTDNSGVFKDTDYIYNRVITCVIMLLVSLAFIVVNGYNMLKSAIVFALCLFKCVEAFSEVLYGIMQRAGKLYKVGFSMAVKAVLSVVCFLTVDLISKQLFLACVTIVSVNIIFILSYDLPNVIKIGVIKQKFSVSKNILLFRNGFFAFVITVLGSYMVNSSRYAIDGLLSDTYQTIYGIIILPASVMSLLGQYIIQPCLTTISDNVKSMNYTALKKIVGFILLCMVGIGVFAFIVAVFLEVPVLELVFGLSLKKYKSDILIIMIGSIMYGLETVVSYILISFRKTGIQALLFSIVSLVAVILSYNLVSSYGIRGASLTYIITMTALAIMFVAVLCIYMRKFKLEWSKIKEEKNEGFSNCSGL